MIHTNIKYKLKSKVIEIFISQYKGGITELSRPGFSIKT